MHKIKVRGVIRNKTGIFLSRDTGNQCFYLPGGTLEDGESFQECLKREILEELGVVAEIGEVLLVREFQNGEKLYLDVWFAIVNTADFLQIDKSRASHGFECSDEGFYPLETLKTMDVIPGNMQKMLEKVPRVEVLRSE